MRKWLRWMLPPVLQNDLKTGAFHERGLENDRLKANCRPECAHYNAFIRESDPFGMVYCPDCDGLTRVSTWLNNLADKVRRAPSL
jgi:hypothetical protein